MRCGDFMNYAAGTVLSVWETLFAALLLAGFSYDRLFRTHMWILFATLAIFTILLMRNADYGLTRRKRSTVHLYGRPDPIQCHRDDFLGVTGFSGQWIIAAQLAFPDLNLEPYLNFGRPASAAYLCGCFCVWRKHPDRIIVLCRAAHLRPPHRR